jgi:hypothetical protein
MLTPDEVLETVCACAAQALFRYHQISGEGLEEMPESFVQSFIADRLGDVLTFTLETSFYRLLAFENKQSESGPLNNRKCDMIVYDHRAGRSRVKADLLDVVEIKKGYKPAEPNGDISKIQQLSAMGASIPCGAVLFFCSTADAQKAEDQARRASHQWFSINVPMFPDYPNEKLVACIRSFRLPTPTGR